MQRNVLYTPNMFWIQFMLADQSPYIRLLDHGAVLNGSDGIVAGQIHKLKPSNTFYSTPMVGGLLIYG